MATSGIFERYELKYRMTLAQYDRLMSTLEPHIQPDRYHRSVIGSLYYDTPDRRLIRRSLEHPVYKEKLRVRSYGPATGDDSVFMELKKKYDHVVHKRRTVMTSAEATAYLSGKPCPVPQTQILREIGYFRTLYPQLQPAMLLMYDREAYVAESDRQLRITFDHRVRFREQELTLGDIESGKLLLPDECLLEIKTSTALPLWLLRLLEEQRLYRTSFSKYGTAFLRTGGLLNDCH